MERLPVYKSANITLGEPTRKNVLTAKRILLQTYKKPNLKSTYYPDKQIREVYDK